jgi:hypothetical protein
MLNNDDIQIDNDDESSIMITGNDRQRSAYRSNIHQRLLAFMTGGEKWTIHHLVVFLITFFR